MHLLIGRQRLAQAALNEQQVAMHIKRVGKARIQAKRALNQLASPAKTTLNKVCTRGKTEQVGIVGVRFKPFLGGRCRTDCVAVAQQCIGFIEELLLCSEVADGAGLCVRSPGYGNRGNCSIRDLASIVISIPGIVFDNHSRGIFPGSQLRIA